ncbi:MAG: hypothetical protein HYX39_11640 [Bacteroidetes bacterium]|nr:hypothetical protein [Bacteroidota bacterium]
MQKPWIFTSNTFEVNTEGSHKKMLALAADTEAKLKAEANDLAINALYQAYFPVYDTYRQIYINYDVAAGNYEGHTLNVETILKENLPKEIKKWEGFVRGIYPEDTPEEHSIFPNKRSPFLQSTYEDRISAVASLAKRLSLDNNPTVQAYASTVQSFYNLLITARESQQNNEGLLGQLSDIREEQRVLLADELYGVLGGLMQKFKADPAQITRFFDLSLIRESGSTDESLPDDAPPPEA